MHPANPVSQFQLEKQIEEPRVPQILRSRQRYQKLQKAIIYPQGELHFQPQQIVIDVNKINLPPRSSLEERDINRPIGGIRRDIDVCLEALISVYEEQRSKGGQNSAEKSSLGQDENVPIIADNAIHRIEHNLVLDYVKTIQKQYGFKNRLGDFQQIKPHRYESKDTKERRSSIRKEEAPQQQRSGKNKQYLHLTLSGKKNKRQSSVPRRGSIQNPHKQSINSTFILSSPYNLLNQGLAVREVEESKEIREKIPDDFRYCISCQMQVMSSNIDYHESFECKNLNQLYHLDFYKLKDLLIHKIGRIRGEITQKIQQMKELTQNIDSLQRKITVREEVCERVVADIQKYVGNLQYQRQNSLENAHQNYLKFKQSIKNIFFETVELTNKLNWFIQIYAKLKDTEHQSVRQGKSQYLMGRLSAKIDQSRFKSGKPTVRFSTGYSANRERSGQERMISPFIYTDQ